MSTSEAELRRFLENPDPQGVPGQQASEQDVRAFLDSGMNPEVAQLFTASHPGLKEREPIERPGAIRSALIGGVSGLTFGFADEGRGVIEGLDAAVKTALPGGRPIAETGQAFSEGFSEGTDRARRTIGAARSDHKLLSLGGEVAGMAVPAIMSGGTSLTAQGATRGTGVAARGGLSAVRRGMAEGAVLGALEGTGHAEGGLAERAKGAATGAAVGAVGDVAVRGIGATLRPAGSQIADLLRPSVSALGDRVGHALPIQPVRDRALGIFMGALGREGGAARIPELAAQAAPEETLMDVLARFGQGARPRLARTAGGAAAGAIAGGAVGGEEGALAGAVLGGGAGSVRLPGNAMQRLARAAESIPSEGGSSIRSFLTERASRAPTRIRQALQERFGSRFEANALDTLDDLMQAQKAAADPLYEAARRHSVPREAVAEFLELPSFQDAYRAGQRKALDEGVRLPDLPDVQSRVRAGFRAAGATDEVLAEAMPAEEVPIQAIDYMKRALDDMIGEARDRGAHDRAATLTAQRARMLGVVDEQVPIYGQARAQWGGDKAAMEAFEAGIADFTGVPDRNVVMQRVRDFTESEAELYRRGVLEAERRNVGRVTDFNRNPDVTPKIVGNSEQREALQAVLPDERSFAGLMEDMGIESNMSATNQFVTGGSPTARIQMDQRDLASGGGLRQLMEWLSPSRAAMSIAESGAASRLRGLNEATVDELAPLLTQSLAEGGGQTILDELEAYLAREAHRAEARAAIPRLGALGAAGMSQSSTRDDDRSGR